MPIIYISGMGNPQYISNPIITGAPETASPENLNPNQPGIDFTSQNATVKIPFAPGVTPILVNVSVPQTNTNVDSITVIVAGPDGTPIANKVSPENTNIVDSFSTVPLPENSTVTITFHTSNGKLPQNVTISIIACYTPEKATTIVSSSSVVPTVSGSTPTLSISSTSTGVTQGIVYTYIHLHLRTEEQ